MMNEGEVDEREVDMLCCGYNCVQLMAQYGQALAFDLNDPNATDEINVARGKEHRVRYAKELEFCKSVFGVDASCFRKLLLNACVVMYSRCRANGKQKLPDVPVPWPEWAVECEELLLLARHRQVVHAVNGIEQTFLWLSGEKKVMEFTTQVGLANVEMFSFWENMAAYCRKYFGKSREDHTVPAS